jgi:hypothetical protein
MPMPAAIAAAAAKLFSFILRVPPQTYTTLVASCLVGYAEKPTVHEVPPSAFAVRSTSQFYM